MEYAMLLNPGHNRVYFGQAPRLAAAELAAMAPALGCDGESVESRQVAGVEYLFFTSAAPLGEAALRRLAGASFFLALFAAEGAGGALRFAPVEVGPPPPFAGIGGMLKYKGKTGELFTRLLINLARSAAAPGTPNTLLDPLAGKGTTLFEAAQLGLDACGVEIIAGTVQEAAGFFRRYLERGRFKHSLHEERIGLPGGGKAKRWRFEYAADRDAFKKGDTRTLELVAGNSQNVDVFFKKNQFGLLVCDLPYGVQHGNVSGEGQAALARSPGQLLEACLPAWRAVHKRGGAIALGWNTLVLGRPRLAAVFEAAGYTVLEAPPYAGLEHRVEQAINRDVLVAVKR